MALPRKKTTMYLDPALLRAAKVVAASTGQHDYQVLEEALRQYLAGLERDTTRTALRSLLDDVAQRSSLTDDDALRLANQELDAVRRERVLGD